MDLQQVLLEELNFEESANLIKSPTWSGIREIPNIDAVYRIGNKRIVYFSSMAALDYDKLLETYKAIWNESEVPLLYLSLPHEIRIYNCYNTPPQNAERLDNEKHLLKRLEGILDVESAITKIRQQIDHFDRIYLDSETFWNTDDGQMIDPYQRADQLLLRAVLGIKKQLMTDFRLSSELAYDLLGRSIFIQYLIDREFLTAELISEMTNSQYDDYQAILGDIEATYLFYEQLSERFQGDIFPVTKQEPEMVTGNILTAIRQFLGGGLYLGGNKTQLSFQAFNFRYIPIGFISELYDLFVDNRRATGSYYTSQALVDFILEETMSLDTISANMRILDPACGSGIFLVRAYQRLVNTWTHENKQPPDYHILSNILKQGIYGCDINTAAARIAVFNLYLAMLDYLPVERFNTGNFSFPQLLGENILALDFFSDQFIDVIGEIRFDRIIGNPPWGKTTLSKSAERIANEREYFIGGKQIVQVFLLYAPEFCKDKGEVAFIAPVKTTILVQDGTHQRFRQQFLEKHQLRIIVNFAALRHELFGGAISPSLVLFYSPKPPKSGEKFAYCVPKPAPLFKQAGVILLDVTEIKFLELQEVNRNPFIWKTALWGNHRDIALISRMKQYGTLDNIAQELKLERGQGFIVARKNRKPKPWLTGMHYLPTDNFASYVIGDDSLEIVRETHFRDATPRMRDVLFKSPSALILKGIKNGKVIAAYSERNIAFQDQVVAFVAQEENKDLLKWLTVFINSKLVQYYYFMTSTSWAVERDRVIQKEFRELPFVIPTSRDLRAVVDLFDQISKVIKEASKLDLSYNKSYMELETHLNQKVYDIFELSKTEQILVEDTIKYVSDYFYWVNNKRRKSGSSLSVQKPNVQILSDYTQVFSDNLNSLLKYQDMGLNATIYVNGAPLCVVEFIRVPANGSGEILSKQSSTDLQRMLKLLDNKLLRQHSSSLFIRRHVRIYDSDRFYIIRPSENRFWTRTQALVDADETLNEWLSSSRELQQEDV